MKRWEVEPECRSLQLFRANILSWRGERWIHLLPIGEWPQWSRKMASSYLGTSASKPEVRLADFFFLLTTYINAAIARFVEFIDAANEQRGHAEQIVLLMISEILEYFSWNCITDVEKSIFVKFQFRWQVWFWNSTLKLLIRMTFLKERRNLASKSEGFKFRRNHQIFHGRLKLCTDFQKLSRFHNSDCCKGTCLTIHLFERYEIKSIFSFFRQIDDIAEFVSDLISRNLSLRINANLYKTFLLFLQLPYFYVKLNFHSFSTFFWYIFPTIIKYFREIVDLLIF